MAGGVQHRGGCRGGVLARRVAGGVVGGVASCQPLCCTYSVELWPFGPAGTQWMHSAAHGSSQSSGTTRA